MTGKLSPEARSLIRDALAEEPRPGGAHRDRLRRGVLSRAAAGGVVTLVGSSVAKASGYALFSTVASSVGIGFGAGLVLAGAAAQIAFTPSAPPAAQDQKPAAAAYSARASAVAKTPQFTALAPLSSALPKAAAPPSAAFELTAHAVNAGSAEARASAGAPGAAASVSSGSGSGSELRAELDLMARVQEALRDTHGARALELIARYDALHPSGLLETERFAAEVFAACQTGDTGRAHRAAQRFLERDSASPLASRVKSACPTANGAAR